MKNELPKRKHPRLKKYDYSSAGAYFITICTQNRMCVLSRIVGRGLAPAEDLVQDVGRGLAPAGLNTTEIILSNCGKIAEEQLLLLEERYPFLKVDKYVIMPNHIHAILVLDNKTAGASPRPTLSDIICTYKSLTTRKCKEDFGYKKLFQTSFYEHIIRGKDDYNETVKYICENSLNWIYDELYAE